MNAADFFSILNERHSSLPVISCDGLNSHDTLVIIVDMVNGFCVSGALASDRCNSVSGGIASLLKRLDKTEKAFVRDCHSDASAEFGAYPPHCHTEFESALVKEVKGFKGTDIPKNSTNGFFSLLKAYPQIGRFKDVIIAGVCTDICVLQLSLSLKSYLNEMNLTTRVGVVADLCETFDLPGHEADYYNNIALALMGNAGINLYKGNRV